jgi:hypothetical protein
MRAASAPRPGVPRSNVESAAAARHGCLGREEGRKRKAGRDASRIRAKGRGRECFALRRPGCREGGRLQGEGLPQSLGHPPRPGPAGCAAAEGFHRRGPGGRGRENGAAAPQAPTVGPRSRGRRRAAGALPLLNVMRQGATACARAAGGSSAAAARPAPVGPAAAAKLLGCPAHAPAAPLVAAIHCPLLLFSRLENLRRAGGGWLRGGGQPAQNRRRRRGTSCALHKAHRTPPPACVARCREGANPGRGPDDSHKPSQ